MGMDVYQQLKILYIRINKSRKAKMNDIRILKKLAQRIHN